MHLIYRNVNEAFKILVGLLQDNHPLVDRSSSRNGDVLYFVEPMTVTYEDPKERVLFNEARDANPFFHLFESLWMLAGRNDVAPLRYYVSTIGDYSDDGRVFHGAYGYRWRNSYPFDQLEVIVDELSKDPDSRRCVLQMWQAENDLGLGRVTKDKPCNTHIYFAVRDGMLDLTVCNRSNDLIWGMLGANVVHMSMLQEYMAARIGVEVGVYNQFTNNLHTYLSKWRRKEWALTQRVDPYTEMSPTALVPLVTDPERFEGECARMVDSIDGLFTEPFLRDVAQPMFAAFRKHKQRQYFNDLGAFELIERVHARDWRIVGKQWLERRYRRWREKSHVSQTGTD